MRSEYMEWAKTRSSARFNLAASGISNVSLAEFPLRVEDLEITIQTGNYGYGPLQERIARHTGVREECIAAATGTSMANHLAMAALIGSGDEVLIEEPAYGPILDVAHYLGGRVERFRRNFETAFEIDPDEVASAMTPQTRLIILTNLHNPSGALISAPTLRALGEIAQRFGAHVLVDEVYLEMPHADVPPFSFPIGEGMGSSADNPFVVTTSLTKGYGLSGLRCGWVLAAPELAKRIWRLNDLFGSVAAHTAERMSVMAFDHLSQFRARSAALLAANRPLLDAFLNSRDDLECFRPAEGTVVFPRLRQGDAESFLKLLREKYETTVVPGRFFEMPQHFRIGIGDQTAELRGGLERLSDALDEL